MSTAHLGPTPPHPPRVPRILSLGVFRCNTSGMDIVNNQASLKEEIEKSLAQSA
jgi:hypothetical protein